LARNIRIVVGEGRTAQQGLLRFILEGEGFDVVGEAATVADLAISIAEGQPDVVVLDDGIGVMAVSMVHEALPQTKVVLVWPSSVVPIGGDARVEPAKILNELGPAVRHVAPVGVGRGLTESFDRPEWIERVRKDPATLRDKLGAGSKETPKRPSVTQLQRRGARLHPGRKARASERMEADEAAAVVALPVGADATEAAASAPSGAEAAAAEPVEERSEWNRRLGMLALSGAAAVSALVLALALGGGRVTPRIVASPEWIPPGAPVITDAPTDGPFSGGSLGGSGYTPSPTFVPDPVFVPPAPTVTPTVTPTAPVAPDTTGDDGRQDRDGGPLGPSFGGDEPRAPSGGDGGGGNGGGGNGGGNGGGGNGPDHAKQGRATGNPFGGPPSKIGLTPAHGDGPGVTVNSAAERGHKARGHAHKH
jgi:hypothetical protein